MRKDRIIPKDGVNPYAGHPGFGETECPLRHTVTPSTGVTMHGFACLHTGGHCLPNEKCESRRKLNE